MTMDVRVEISPGVWADIPLDVVSRARDEAELNVMRERLLDDLTAVDDPAADRRLEEMWETATGHPRPADLIRSDDAELMRGWNAYEDRQRARLNLPPRVD